MIWLKEESGKMTKKMNREMAVVTYLFMILFLIMAGYIVYFVVHDSDKVLNNPQNKRQELLAKRVTKGSILASGGQRLAYTKTSKSGEETRCDRTGIHRRLYDADKQYQSVERDVK